MRKLLTFLTFAYLLTLLNPDLARAQDRSPITYYVLTDSTVVVGRPVRQDSTITVVAKRSGELTYLESYQIVRKSYTKPFRPQTERVEATLFAFTLRDGATIYGRVVRRTPVAVVVRQSNGTQTYIDPGDILSTTPVADAISSERTGASSNVEELAAFPYLLSSRTAYTPRAGQVYYRNTYLLQNELEIGLTNGWSLGVAYSPRLREFYGRNRYVGDMMEANVDFGPQVYSRIGVPIGRSVRLGAGLSVQFPQALRDYFTPPSLSVQGLASFGGVRSNVTLGYTFRVDRSGNTLQSDGTLTLGARQYLSPSLSVISDNTIRISEDGGRIARLGAALRVHRHWHAFDLGVLTTLTQRLYYSPLYSSSYYPPYVAYTSNQFQAYPYVSYAVQLGRR